MSAAEGKSYVREDSVSTVARLDVTRNNVASYNSGGEMKHAEADE